jgi:hypothetical protein
MLLTPVLVSLSPANIYIGFNIDESRPVSSLPDHYTGSAQVQA